MVNKKKLLAMLLIFTLTFSYFAVVTEAIAATSFVSLFGGSSNKENENVEFQAYLQNGEETSNDLVSDVNNENLAIQLKLDVKKQRIFKKWKGRNKATRSRRTKLCNQRRQYNCSAS